MSKARNCTNCCHCAVQTARLHCRRYPPYIDSDWEADGPDISFIDRFPTVHPTWLCGEWSPLDPNETPLLEWGGI